MATVWWWVVKPSETGAASRPNDARLISTPDSGAEYNALVTGGTWNGEARYQGPFTTKAAAQQASPGGGSLGDVISAGVNAGVKNDVGVIGSGARAAQAVPSGLSGLAAIGDFFGRMTEASTWMRVAEVILGLALISVGVAHLTKAVPTATQIAKMVK